MNSTLLQKMYCSNHRYAKLLQECLRIDRFDKFFCAFLCLIFTISSIIALSLPVQASEESKPEYGYGWAIEFGVQNEKFSGTLHIFLGRLHSNGDSLKTIDFASAYKISCNLIGDVLIHSTHARLNGKQAIHCPNVDIYKAVNAAIQKSRLPMSSEHEVWKSYNYFTVDATVGGGLPLDPGTDHTLLYSQFVQTNIKSNSDFYDSAHTTLYRNSLPLSHDPANLVGIPAGQQTALAFKYTCIPDASQNTKGCRVSYRENNLPRSQSPVAGPIDFSIENQDFYIGCSPSGLNKKDCFRGDIYKIIIDPTSKLHG